MTSGRIIHPALAKFALAVNEAYERVCDDPTHDEYFKLFDNTEIRLFAYDGLVAKFYEEGIEFYPEGDA